MEKLKELETYVLELSDTEYSRFRLWFWEQESERLDAQIEKDISENKLESLAENAMKDFKQGNCKTFLQ